MGAGASAETARTTVTSMLSGKPADASDINVSPIVFDTRCIFRNFDIDVH